MFEPIADLIFAVVTLLAGALGGSVGLAIIIVSVSLRLALFPLTYRIAKHSYEQQQTLRRLKPELDRIQEQHVQDPSRKASEVFALYRRHGYQPFSLFGLVVLLAQAPIFGAFFTAIRRGLGAGVRFLGIANLGNPSVVMALVVAALAYVGGVVNAPEPANTLILLASALVVLYFAWKVSAAMALYWASSSVVGIAQSALVRRRSRMGRRGASA